MKFLSLDNILLLRRVIGAHHLDKENALKLASTMKFLNKYEDRVSLATLNKLVLYVYKKHQPVRTESLLDSLQLPEELKRAYSMSLADFSKNRALPPIESDFDELQKIYGKMNDFYQSYIKEIPEGQRSGADFVLDKTKHMKELEKELFDNIVVTRYLTIDSRDRDHDQDNDTSYRVYLQSPLKQVFKMQIISAEIPRGEYLINEYNNVIHFQETTAQIVSNQCYEAIIPVGDYNITDLLTIIQTQMNVVGASSYTISLVNDRVRIASDLTGGDGLFRLKFNENGAYFPRTIAKVIGYQPTNKMNAATYTGEMLYNTSCDTSFLFYIDNISRNMTQNFNFFEKIVMENDLTFFNSGRTYSFEHEYYPPIELDYLQLRWTDRDDNPVSFNGLPHSITFKVDMFA